MLGRGGCQVTTVTLHQRFPREDIIFRVGNTVTNSFPVGVDFLSMSRHEATFEIETRNDAHTVRILTERIHDTMREELGSSFENDTESNELLQQFAAIREATKNQSSGSLTVIYEQDDESVDD